MVAMVTDVFVYSYGFYLQNTDFKRRIRLKQSDDTYNASEHSEE